MLIPFPECSSGQERVLTHKHSLVVPLSLAFLGTNQIQRAEPSVQVETGVRQEVGMWDQWVEIPAPSDPHRLCTGTGRGVYLS